VTIEHLELSAFVIGLPMHPMFGMEHVVLLPVLALAVATFLIAVTWDAPYQASSPRRCPRRRGPSRCRARSRRQPTEETHR
jgi:hypothetical protein